MAGLVAAVSCAAPPFECTRDVGGTISRMTCPGRYIATFAIIIGSMIAAAATARPPVVGEPAPSFEVTYFDGTKVSLADLRGEVVILNFWATWCAPCREELPLLDG